jgi:ribonuclease P protein component
VETLKTNSEFERVRRVGRSWAVGPVVLNAAPNGTDTLRCGFIVGKKVGNAVKRNRARRLMREAIRLRLPHLKSGWDLVLVARSSIVEADAQSVDTAIDTALKRGKLFAHDETDRVQSRIISRDAGSVSPGNAPLGASVKDNETSAPTEEQA